MRDKRNEVFIIVSKMACTCKNITAQTMEAYDNMFLIIPPKRIDLKKNDDIGSLSKSVCIDPCVAAEIIELWRLGIKTTGSCCGHGDKDAAYIGVREEYIETMKALGYKVRENVCRPGAQDSFIPKSICDEASPF